MKTILTTILILLAQVPIFAQSDRSLPAATDFETVRPVGEKRLYHFFGNTKEFGTLTSVVKNRVEVDGRTGYEIEELLVIDFSALGGETTINESRKHFIASDGTYLGDAVNLGPVEKREELVLSREGSDVVGYFTRSGNEVEQSISVPLRYSAFDNNYIDQLEIILSRHDLSPGVKIIDSVFQPLSLVTAQFAGTVQDFLYTEIYKRKFDSVFFITLTQPFAANLYYTPDRQLVKVTMVNLGYRIYLDAIEQTVTSANNSRASVSSGFALVKIPALIPHYIAFLLIAAACLMLFVGRGIRWPESYISLLFGAGASTFAFLLIVPASNFVVEKIVIPGITSGGSIYSYAIIPNVIFAGVQLLCLFAALKFVMLARSPKEHRLRILGAFVGAGVGLVEVLYRLGWSIQPLFSFALVERSSLILLQIAAGTILGSVILGSRARISAIVGVLFGVNMIVRYLPVFVQTGLIDAGALHFVLGAISLALSVYALIIRPALITPEQS